MLGPCHTRPFTGNQFHYDYPTQYVTVVTDPLLLEDTGGAILLTKLQALESKMAIESQPIPGSVTWRRQVMEHNLGDDLQVIRNNLPVQNRNAKSLIL